MAEIVDFIKNGRIFPRNLITLSNCKKYVTINDDHPMFQFAHKKQQVQQLINELQSIHDQMVD